MEPRFTNRDISWLEFNRRVLFQAEDKEHPLLERVRFMSIFTSNLDEFFMKRVGRLQSMIAREVQLAAPDGLYPAQLLSEIRCMVQELLARQSEIYRSQIVPELISQGIEIAPWESLDESELKHLNEYFDRLVFPTLTPLSVDRSHPFPFLSNLSLSLGMKLSHPGKDDLLFARVKIPSDLPHWIPTKANARVKPIRLVRVQELIEHNLHKLFPKMLISGVTPFRVTRNADMALVEDESDDVVEVVEEELRRRRLAQVVRLEHGANPDPWVIEFLASEIGVHPEEIYEIGGEIHFRGLDDIYKLDLPDLKFKSWIPAIPQRLTDESADIFSLIRDGDLLAHHPYESFPGSVERFIQSAVEDPQVFTIKMTFYRTGPQSRFIPLLVEAAERGKQVVCVMEVKARFDEARNLHWAEKLEGAGVHVVYGVTGLKTHAKIALVVRREHEGFNFYAHIGTGNYNDQTAKVYTDLSLFTSNAAITNDVIEVFNALTGVSLKDDFKELLVSPINLRASFVKLIRTEIENAKAGKPSGIIAKMNSIEDTEICELLYEASQAGVPIQLIIRGFCCLRAGVPGLSDNIQVYSIVGRFLEHSRIFFFRNGSANSLDGKLYFGSADWMRRNINDRVETTVPVLDPALKKRILDILMLQLNDHSQRWRLETDGTYTLLRDPNIVDAQGSQARIMQLTRERVI
jgi:polyphosphate kinase